MSLDEKYTALCELARDLALAHEENPRVVPSLETCKELWNALGSEIHMQELSAQYEFVTYTRNDFGRARDSEKWQEFAYWVARVLWIYDQQVPNSTNIRGAIGALVAGAIYNDRLDMAYDLLARWMGTTHGAQLAQELHHRLGARFWKWKAQKYGMGKSLEPHSRDSALCWARVCVATKNYPMLGVFQDRSHGERELTAASFLQNIPLRLDRILVRFICTNFDFVQVADGRMTKSACG